MFLRLISLTALLLLADPLMSKWGPAGCAPVGVPASPQAAPLQSAVMNAGNSGWWRFSDAPDYWGWWKAGRLTGRWHSPSNTWNDWDGRNWGPDASPPWGVKPVNLPGARQQSGGGINYGLDMQQVGQHGERFWICGNEVNCAEFCATIKDNFKDDSKTPEVTVIDTNDSRRAQTVTMLTQKFGDRIRLQDYNATDKNQQWAIEPFKLDQDKRFQTAGAITVMAGPKEADGFAKVWGAWYGGDAAKIADGVERKVSKDYDPNKVNEGTGISINWKWLWDNVLYPLLIALMGGGAAVVAMKPAAKEEEEVAEPEPKIQAAPMSVSARVIEVLELWKQEEAKMAEEAKQKAADAEAVRQAFLAYVNGGIKS